MTAAAWALLGSFLVLLVLMAWPLGRWVAVLATGAPPAWMQKAESGLYRLAGVDPQQGMGWSRYALCLLVFNGTGLLFVYAVQRLQGLLPLNPQAMPAVSADSSFNTAIRPLSPYSSSTAIMRALLRVFVPGGCSRARAAGPGPTGRRLPRYRRNPWFASPFGQWEKSRDPRVKTGHRLRAVP